MKDLIWQTWVGGRPVPEYARQSMTHFQRYAERHNLEYRFDVENFFNFDFKERFLDANTDAVLSKLRPIFDEEFDQYDRVVIIDCDVLINDFSKNIFDEARTEVCGVPYTRPAPHIIAESVQNNVHTMEYPSKFDLQGFAVSGGVLVLSKAFRQFARKKYLPPNVRRYAIDELFYIQNIKNVEIISYMDFRWNFNCRLHKYFNKSYFLHFHGGTKKYMGDFFHTGNYVLDPEDCIPVPEEVQNWIKK